MNLKYLTYKIDYSLVETSCQGAELYSLLNSSNVDCLSNGVGFCIVRSALEVDPSNWKSGDMNWSRFFDYGKFEIGKNIHLECDLFFAIWYGLLKYFFRFELSSAMVISYFLPSLRDK